MPCAAPSRRSFSREPDRSPTRRARRWRNGRTCRRSWRSAPSFLRLPSGVSHRRAAIATAATTVTNNLGIIAGGGDLPRAIAESVAEAGRGIGVVALLGSADPWVENYPHVWASMGEVAKINNFLKGQ